MQKKERLNYSHDLPLVSIILPVYNGEKFLEFAIQSILDQSYVNFELIIINDNSSDCSLEIAEKFSRIDFRIKLFSNTSNLKLPASLNIGHNKAEGKIVTWTSHDNLLKPKFLQETVDFMLLTKADIVYTNYDVIFEDGSIKREHRPGNINKQIFGNQVGSSFLYKIEVYEYLNGYDESLFLVEDYDFWLRSVFNFSFKKLEKNLYSYRIQNNSLTSKITNDPNWKKLHNDSLLQMFNNIKQDLFWNDITVNFLIALHLRRIGAFKLYLDHKKIIKKDLEHFCNKIKYQELLAELYEELRLMLIRHPEINTISNMRYVIRYEIKILIHQKFSFKSSLKLLIKSVQN